jgi:Flp pilus assembly protein TadG
MKSFRPDLLMKQRTGMSRSVRRGALTVEFAIVAPLIFLLFLGGLEMTSLNFVRQTAGNASYEAARKAIIPGGTIAQAQTEGLRLMNSLGVGTGAVVTVTQTPQQVTATISVPAANHSWGLVRFCGGLTLRQSCTLTRE